ncbi:hypothetical protein M9H77_04637 [Catharanthus roseus]|uniref:Uncharacterized protein n=1 Tax=Catharanthus roseus TaxID=4058 RepID=A0ACC0CEU7_CATRO|nr:hypothetical protein M9H77_04637 [Catharanthus roseus]
MGLTSLQVCMDSADWLQGTIHEEGGMDSSSPSAGDMLACSRPLIERRLRPQHDQALKCPRCDSTHTKFCYYNNYSLSQPRYFCKTCRRYWTKGGTLRNIPVGGGCRKNKKISTKKSSNDPSINQINPGNSSINSSSNNNNNNNPTDLQLSFPHDQVQFSHLNNLLGNPNFMMLDQNPPIDFMENKLYDNFGSSIGDHFNNNNNATNFHNLSAQFGMMMSSSTSMDDHNGAGNGIMDQRLMLPYEGHHHEDPILMNALDVKPNTKLLSLEWHNHHQDQAAGKDNFGYLNGVNIGPWTPAGLMNGYGSSTTNPLV